MFNIRKLIALKGHHKEKSYPVLLKHSFPDHYKKVAKLAEKFNISKDLALAIYASGTPEPWCPVCKKEKAFGPFKVKSTCGKSSCMKVNQASAVRTAVTRRTINADAIKAIRKLRENTNTSEAKALISGIMGFSSAVQEHNPKLWSRFLKEFPYKGGNPIAALTFYIEHGEYARCKTCMVPLKNPRSRWCWGKCASKEGMRKAHTTMKKIHGGVGFAVKKIRAAATSTMQSRLGVPHAAQSQEVRDRYIASMLKNHGVSNARLTLASKKAFETRYADPKRIEKERKKYEATMEAKYGTYWQAVITEKMTTARYKTYSVIHKKHEFLVQGYEPYLIRELIARGCPAERIQPYGIKVWYKHPVTKKKALYVADLSIRDTNVVYEVKSTYTAGLSDKKIWRVVAAKSKALEDAGYSSRMVIVSPSKGMCVITNPIDTLREN